MTVILPETYSLKPDAAYNAYDYHITIHRMLLRTARVMGFQYYQFDNHSNYDSVSSTAGYVVI